MNNRIFATIALAISFTTTTHAALVARGTDMVYDDVNNITWTADANLFQTQAASNPNLVSEIISANGGVIHDTPNSYDTVPNSGIYTLTSADFKTSTGKLTWWGAQAWAKDLTLGGVSGWALPTVKDQDDFFVYQLGATYTTSLTTYHTPNYNLFSNVQGYPYWSSSEASGNANYPPVQGINYSNLTWGVTFDTDYGIRNYYEKYIPRLAWAVHAGDVAAVPLPGAVWLFLSGLIGLMGLKRRGSIG